MAYSFGGGINPQLGAIDYSPILRGAQQYAQSTAAGSAAIGQGIGSALASIGQGVQGYYEKKEQKKMEEQAASTFQTMAKENPEFARYLGIQDINDKGLVKSVIKSLGGPAGAIAAAKQIEKFKTDQQAASVANFLAQGQGTMPSVIDQRKFSPQALLEGKKQYLDTAKTQAEINRLNQQALTGGLDPTSAMRDTQAIIKAEVAAGRLSNNPTAIQGRVAELMAQGGRDRPTRFTSAGTFVSREGQSNPTAAVKDEQTGQIGFVDKDNKFNPLDPKKWQPMTLGDANAFLNETAFKKLADEVVQQENTMKALNRYSKRVGDLSTGIQRGVDNITRKLNTVLEQPLSKAEENLTLAEAQKQRFLGMLRTEIMGPGVLTEIDAQRILEALGGDINSIFTNKELVVEIVNEIANEKLNKYQQDLDVYNTHVAGRYGQTGFKQRELVRPTSVFGGGNASLVDAAKQELARRRQGK